MPDIRYHFVSTGQNEVMAGFRGIRDAALEADRATRKREASAKTASSTEARAAREVEKQTAKAAREQEREAQAAERSAKRAADAKIREAKRAADHVSRIRDRHFAEQQRSEERALEAGNRARVKAFVLEQQRLRAESRAQEKVREERLRSIGLSGTSGDKIAMGGKFLRAGATAVAGVGAVGLGVGTALAGSAVRESARLQAVTNRLAISARGAGEEGVDPTKLRKEFEAAAIANPGVSASAVAAGAQAFVTKTGDLDAARRFSGTFATAASASGSEVADIADAAADLFKKFDIKTIEDMQQALASLTYQGKQGAFEIKDAASQFARLSAAASRFGVAKGAEGVKVLGGLTQIAKEATGSPEQAATAVEAMFRQLTGAHSGKLLKAAGVDVFEKGSTSKTRDVRAVIGDTIAKTGGNLTKLQGIFGDEGIRAVSPLISTFNQAKDSATGSAADKTAAGLKALNDQLAKTIDAPGDWGEVVKDAALAQSDAGAKLEGAWQKIIAAAGDKLAPALAEIAGKIADDPHALEAFAAALGFAADAALALASLMEKLGLIKIDHAALGEAQKAKAARAQDQIDALAKEPASPERDKKITALNTAKQIALAKAEQEFTIANTSAAGDGNEYGATAEQMGEDPAKRRRMQILQREMAMKELGIDMNTPAPAPGATPMGVPMGEYGMMDADTRPTEQGLSEDQKLAAQANMDAARELKAAASALTAAAAATKQPSVFDGG